MLCLSLCLYLDFFLLLFDTVSFSLSHASHTFNVIFIYANASDCVWSYFLVL